MVLQCFDLLFSRECNLSLRNIFVPKMENTGFLELQCYYLLYNNLAIAFLLNSETSGEDGA